MEKTREIIPTFLCKIDKIETSNLVFKGKRKCDNLKGTGKGMEWKGERSKRYFRIIVAVNVLANYQVMNNVIFTENPAKAKQHSSILGVINVEKIP